MVQKEKLDKERMNMAEKFLAGVGIVVVAGAGLASLVFIAMKLSKAKRINIKTKAENLVETVTDTVHRETEAIKDNATYAIDEVSRALSNADAKIESAKKHLI